MIIEVKDIQNNKILLNMKYITAVVESETSGCTAKVWLTSGSTLMLSDPSYEEFVQLFALYEDLQCQEKSVSSPLDGLYSDDELEVISNPAYKVHHRYVYTGKPKKRKAVINESVEG